MSQKELSSIRFDEMNLSPSVFSAVEKSGYKTPTPIQALTIPLISDFTDIVGQARTGTGKTAAFALPLLSRIDLANRRPQVLVLTPTRELAIQVAQSFKTYGADMKKLNVLAVYGGQGFDIQLNQLKRGVHVIVGTPGRLMDHMRRKTVSFSDLSCLVLDEADEMLHMGFIDDVEWILEHTPRDTQTALFSATMPGPILKISRKYLKDPKEVIVKADTDGLSTIDQKYWLIKGAKKSTALVRILQAASFDGVIVFTRTRTATLEVTRTLEENGFKAEALNGDIAQAARERTVNRLKNGQIDILVATDVAARGLDVDRISHVINYDMPPKIEPYIHRIGRTGRAGRQGEAILFVNRKERWMLKRIENTTGRPVKEIFLPSNKAINKKRVADFKQQISQVLETEDLAFFTDLVESVASEQDIPVSHVAAALARISQGTKPFLLPKTKEKTPAAQKPRPVEKQKIATPKSKPAKSKRKEPSAAATMKPVEKGMERYRIEVGHKHGLRPKDVVGAISNEAGLESRFIGSIHIDHDHAHVDLPFGMPKNIYHLLKNTWVRSQKMQISRCA